MLLVVEEFIKNHVSVLSGYSIPGSIIIGGVFLSMLALVGQATGSLTFQFYDIMRAFLLLVFFNIIGFSASFEFLKKCGAGVALLLAALSGMALASRLGVRPLIGVAAGSLR